MEVRHVEEKLAEGQDGKAAREVWLKARHTLRLPKLAKATQGHGYQYLSLPDLLAALSEPLRQAGFILRWNTWSPTADSVGVRCVLTHLSGWSESAELICRPQEVVGGRMNGIQARGAYLTYAQRYTLLSVLGTCADVDTDGAAPFQDSSKLAERGVGEMLQDHAKPAIDF